jgi:hypothetical protein
MLNDNYVTTNKLINLRWIKKPLKNSLTYIFKNNSTKIDWNNVFWKQGPNLIIQKLI